MQAIKNSFFSISLASASCPQLKGMVIANISPFP